MLTKTIFQTVRFALIFWLACPAEGENFSLLGTIAGWALAYIVYRLTSNNNNNSAYDTF